MQVRYSLDMVTIAYHSQEAALREGRRTRGRVESRITSALRNSFTVGSSVLEDVENDEEMGTRSSYKTQYGRKG